MLAQMQTDHLLKTYFSSSDLEHAYFVSDNVMWNTFVLFIVKKMSDVMSRVDKKIKESHLLLKTIRSYKLVDICLISENIYCYAIIIPYY